MTGEKVIKTGRRTALARGEPVVVVLEEDEFIDEFQVVVTGWKRRDAEERATPGPPVRAFLKPDEYVDEGGRLRVRKPREALPPAARVALQPDEYIDDKGVVRAGRTMRQKLDAAPPIDFPDIVVDEAAPAPTPKRRPSCDATDEISKTVSTLRWIR